VTTMWMQGSSNLFLRGVAVIYMINTNVYSSIPWPQQSTRHVATNFS